MLTFMFVGGIIFWSCASNVQPRNPMDRMPTNVPVELEEQEIQEEAIEVVAELSERDKKINEVVALWNMFYDDQGVRAHKRRAKFPEYASYLVDAVEMYENTPTDIGGQLPTNVDNHLIVATMAALETSVKPEVIGYSRGEVGLLQIHGKGALAGHTKQEVIKNPKLGLILGVRWLAYHTQFCDQKSNIDGWAKPLSLYGAGLKGGRHENGKCKKIGVARKRVRLAKFYRTRIRAAISS